MSNKFNLTEKRQTEAIKMLQGQYNINLIAMHFGIHPDVLSIKLKEVGIDAKELQKDGIRRLRANLYADLHTVEDPKDKVKLTLDVLKHYDKSDDVASAKSETSITEIPAITFSQIEE